MPLDLKNIKYTSKAKVHEILSEYKKKMTEKKLKTKLILCHGKEHKPKFSNAITLDILEIVNPDLVLNGWKEDEMKKIPANFFDIIYLQHCPLGNPFNPKHNILWKNLKRILTKEGQIRSYSIAPLYSKNVYGKWFYEYNRKNKKDNIEKVINEVIDNFKKIGFKNISHRKVYKYEKYNNSLSNQMTIIKK